MFSADTPYSVDTPYSKYFQLILPSVKKIQLILPTVTKIQLILPTEKWIQLILPTVKLIQLILPTVKWIQRILPTEKNIFSWYSLEWKIFSAETPYSTNKFSADTTYTKMIKLTVSGQNIFRWVPIFFQYKFWNVSLTLFLFKHDQSIGMDSAYISLTYTAKRKK